VEVRLELYDAFHVDDRRAANEALWIKSFRKLSQRRATEECFAGALLSHVDTIPEGVATRRPLFGIIGIPRL